MKRTKIKLKRSRIKRKTKYHKQKKNKNSSLKSKSIFEWLAARIRAFRSGDYNVQSLSTQSRSYL